MEFWDSFLAVSLKHLRTMTCTWLHFGDRKWQFECFEYIFFLTLQLVFDAYIMALTVIETLVSES